MGVISTVLLSAGVLRHYWDIYVHCTVRGISFIFVAIDAAGDVFSLVSVCTYRSSSFSYSVANNLAVFQPTLDILGIIIYATEFVLWCGVFVCGGYFNLTPWLRQKMSARKQRPGNEETSVTEGQDNDLGLTQIPSSTSVFRTSSSINSRVSMRSQNTK